jgi:hypothetical protein
MTLIIKRGRLTIEKWISPTLRYRDAFRFVVYKQTPRERDMFGFVRSPVQTIVIDLTKDPEDIFAEFSATTRNQVRKAEKHGITIEPADIDDFAAFFNAFAQQLGIPGLAAAEYRTYADHLLIRKAMHRGEALAMRACLIDEGLSRARELKSGSTRLKSADGADPRMAGYANRLLHWSLIQELKQKGCRLYDFGGCVLGSSDTALANITTFKLGFSKTVVTENDFRSWPLYLREAVVGRLRRGAPQPLDHRDDATCE